MRAEDGKVDDGSQVGAPERSRLKMHWFGSMGAVKMDAEVPTYKFEVENVRRLKGNCSSRAHPAVATVHVGRGVY